MRIRRTWLALALLIFIAAYLVSGVYFVQPNERGVVRWFGRVPEAYARIPAGLHYALPWPFCRVDCPKTTEERRVYVGPMPEERAAIARGDMETIMASPASDMLTGDVNILKVTMVVKYHVLDPRQYLFGAENPDQLVRDTVQAVLIERLAGLPVDQALTLAKADLQNEVRARAQAMLDDYQCGVMLAGTLDLESIDPPRAVISAFQDVVSAKKDGERAIDRAIAESNRTLARARGEVARQHEEAEAYRQTRVSRARGEAARFLSVLAEYSKSPDIFRQRLWLQTMESVLPKIRSYVLDQKPGDPQTNVRIIEPKRE